MSEELKDKTINETTPDKEKNKVEVTEEKELSDEELAETNRLIRKLKKYTEKYNFKYPDDLFAFVKSEKEKTEDKKEEKTTNEDGGYITIHKFSEGDEVWVAEYNSKHENKTFETIDNVYKFRPEKYTVREVILNGVVRYKFKGSQSVYEECMVFKTKDEAIVKCEELNII